MKTSRCSCGNTLFFDSIRCVACGRSTGYCPTCRAVHDLVVETDEERLSCGHCSAQLVRCKNFAVEDVCNVCVGPDDVAENAEPLCEFCAFTRVVPDLSVDGNRERWRRLERAKRRALERIRAIGVPFSQFRGDLPLWFEFKADGEQPVSTGHANGVITINIREADDVEREKSRVKFGEPHRTLVGHFRHELGHYFWQLFVTGTLLADYRELFGNENEPSYDAAREAYYESGPPDDWPNRFVSAYAAMHPWEDFAETFGAYLDLRAVLGTAVHFGICRKLPRDFDEMLTEYQTLGVVANEWNRDLGLLDLVPEVFVPPVAEKLKFVHRVMHTAASE